MPKILLIDDRPDNLTSLAATILSFIPEAIILEALSGQDGINLAIKELPDVILLDVHMPDMDGFDVLDILKANLKAKIIPVILITANYADAKNKIKGLEYGADAFLTKPIDSNELIAQINVMLRIKQAEDRLREEKGNLEILVDERTAHLRKEIYLREQKEKSLIGLSSIVENSTNEIYVVDTSSLKFLYANKEALRNLDFSKDELYSLTPLDINPEFTRDSFLLAVKPLLSGEKMLIQFEAFHQRKNGSTYITDVNIQLTNFEGVNSFVVIIRDISARKQAEKVLKESNEFNQSLINTIPFGLDIVDMEGNVLFMNNLLKDAIGLENPSGKCWDFYKDNGEQCPECPLKGNLELGETNICEVHNVLGGKEYEVTHTVMNYKGQKALLEIFRDITEEKSAEKKIRQLSHGLEQSPEMVIITDIDGNIEYANPRTTEITGYLLEELIGKNASILQSGNTPKDVYKDLWDTILNGKIWKGELLNKKKNGETYWESASISPIIDKKGNITNFISIKDDITEKIAAMNELIETKEKAVQSDRMKSEFLAQMSHEIRTPLNVIANNYSLLKEEFSKYFVKDIQNSFKSIELASKRIIRTVELILNMSEIQSGSFALQQTKVNLISQVISPFIKEYEFLAVDKGLIFSFNNLVDNPILYCDEYCVIQIFTNLIDNAIKYTPKGKVTVSLYYNEQNKFAFEVSDTGVGISKEFQSNLFIPFVQEEHGYSRKFDGNGLGLALVKAYCNLNNANVEFESEKNVGSTFRVIFN